MVHFKLAGTPLMNIPQQEDGQQGSTGTCMGDRGRSEVTGAEGDRSSLLTICFLAPNFTGMTETQWSASTFRFV